MFLLLLPDLHLDVHPFLGAILVEVLSLSHVLDLQLEEVLIQDILVLVGLAVRLVVELTADLAFAVQFASGDFVLAHLLLPGVVVLFVALAFVERLPVFRRVLAVDLLQAVVVVLCEVMLLFHVVRVGGDALAVGEHLGGQLFLIGGLRLLDCLVQTLLTLPLLFGQFTVRRAGAVSTGTLSMARDGHLRQFATLTALRGSGTATGGWRFREYVVSNVGDGTEFILHGIPDAAEALLVTLLHFLPVKGEHTFQHCGCSVKFVHEQFHDVDQRGEHGSEGDAEQLHPLADPSETLVHRPGPLHDIRKPSDDARQHVGQFRARLAEDGSSLRCHGQFVPVFDEQQGGGSQCGHQQADGVHLRDEVEHLHGCCCSLRVEFQHLRLDGGELCGDGVSRQRGSQYQKRLPVFRDEVGKHRHPLHQQTCAGDGVFDDRHQFLTQFHRQVLEAFLRLVESGLHGVVLHVELLDDRRAVLVCLLSESLALPHVVDLVGERGEDAHGTAAVEPHVIEHLHHRLRVLCAQAVCESQHGPVGILCYEFREVLHAHACNLCELLRVSLHLREHVAEGSGRHLLAEEVLVHDGTESHDLRLRQPQLLAETRHAGGEVHEVSRLGGGVLCQFVDGRAGGQHGTVQSHALILAECHGKFADLVNGPLSEVIAEGHAYLVGCIDEFHDGVRGGDAEPSGSTGKLVEFLAGGARVHALELFVHLLHLLLSLPRVLAYVGHLLFHVSKVLDHFPHGDRESCRGTEYLRHGTPVGIQEIEEFLPDRNLQGRGLAVAV